MLWISVGFIEIVICFAPSPRKTLKKVKEMNLVEEFG